MNVLVMWECLSISLLPDRRQFIKNVIYRTINAPPNFPNTQDAFKLLCLGTDVQYRHKKEKIIFR